MSRPAALARGDERSGSSVRLDRKSTTSDHRLSSTGRVVGSGHRRWCGELRIAFSRVPVSLLGCMYHGAWRDPTCADRLAVKSTRTFGEGDAAVQALTDVSVDFPTGGFTAIMGPSGSGKSTLMHLPGRPGQSDFGHRRGRRDRALGPQGRRADTVAARQARLRLPGLQPGAGPRRGGEHPPSAHPRRARARPRVVRPARGHGRHHRPSLASALRALRRPAATRRRRPGAHPQAGGRSSPTSRPATWIPRPPPICSTLLRRAADEFGQTIIMVTHDASAASYADRLIVLVDGRIVRDEGAGDAEAVLELMKSV